VADEEQLEIEEDEEDEFDDMDAVRPMPLRIAYRRAIVLCPYGFPTVGEQSYVPTDCLR